MRCSQHRVSQIRAVRSVPPIVLLVTLGLSLAAVPARGQSTVDRRGWWGYRAPPRFPDPARVPDRLFVFCRILYQSVLREPLGHGWNTDYPMSDINFMNRFAEFTKAEVSRNGEGHPDHVVVTLSDDAIFDYPFIFMSDVGTAGFEDVEVARLRAYLLRGGLYVDDFWGQRAWTHWVHEIGKVLPPADYPIVDLPSAHPIFRVQYDVREVPQIPSIQFWRRTGGTRT